MQPPDPTPEQRREARERVRAIAREVARDLAPPRQIDQGHDAPATDRNSEASDTTRPRMHVVLRVGAARFMPPAVPETPAPDVATPPP